jgi:hypothetical protein
MRQLNAASATGTDYENMGIEVRIMVGATMRFCDDPYSMMDDQYEMRISI